MSQTLANALLTMFFLCIGTSAQTRIQLRSGNGTVGGPDSQIHILVGPANAPFPRQFTAQDFLNARTGPNARIVASRGSWLPRLLTESSSLAQWITTNPEDQTGLYAISFPLASPATAAKLVVRFAVDDWLGDTVNPGIFLNDQPVPGIARSGRYDREFVFVGDVGPLLLPGTNWLYLNAADGLAGAGLLFAADLTICGVACADYVQFGAACINQGGWPLLQVAELPFLGATFTELLQGLPVNQLGIHVLGVSRTSWLGIPLPLDLTPNGMPGCSLYASMEITSPFRATSGGVHVMRLTVPSNPTLIGQRFYTQAIVVSPAANPASLIESNAGCATIGR